MGDAASGNESGAASPRSDRSERIDPWFAMRFVIVVIAALTALAIIIVQHQSAPDPASTSPASTSPVPTPAVSAAAEQRHLIVADQRSDTIFASCPARDGMRLTLSWIHSIEHTPWTETYEISDDHLILREITLEGYGAGVPANPGGRTYIEDGVIHVVDLDRRIDRLQWIHSHDTEHTLEICGTTIHPQDLPHHVFAYVAVIQE